MLVVSIFSGATPITQAKNLHKYSGEEIFAGIVFGQGEISKKFPEIWNTNDYNAIPAKISSPEYLCRFFA